MSIVPSKGCERGWKRPSPLHRSRTVVDFQFVADLGLLGRAIENVTRDGYQDYREEPAVQVYQKLGNAIQLLEAKHRADQAHGELAALLDAERRLTKGPQAKVAHAWWLERFSTGLEWPIRYLQNLRVDCQASSRCDSTTSTSKLEIGSPTANGRATRS